MQETWRRMLRLKTSGEVEVTGARKTGNRAVMGILAVGLLMAGATVGQAQGTVAAPQKTTTVPITSSKIGPAAPVTYDNKYEIFGALNFQNFQAGQSLPRRMNLGGGEFLATYWLPGDHWFTRNIGVGVDYRIDAGTTPVKANSGITTPNAEGQTGINNRPLVYLNTFMAGAQYRSKFRNQYAALNFHGYGGVSHGTFDSSYRNLIVPVSQANTATGLYSNRTAPMAALGASIDFNVSKRMAIRLSPDLILENYGTELREFVAVSGGVIWRFGKQK